MMAKGKPLGVLLLYCVQLSVVVVVVVVVEVVAEAAATGPLLLWGRGGGFGEPKREKKASLQHWH